MSKKLCLVFIINLFIVSFLVSQSIEVTDPQKDEWVAAGAPYTIKWTRTGSMDSKVKIRLYNANGTRRIKNIVNSTANDGSYTVPRTGFDGVPRGSYVIRVKTLDNLVSDDSEKFNLRSNTLQTTTPKPPTPQSNIDVKKQLPVSKDGPYIQKMRFSWQFSSSPQFWQNDAEGPYYAHHFRVQVGNRGTETTKNKLLYVKTKRRESFIDPVIPTESGQRIDGIRPGRSKTFEFISRSYKPGVFENRVYFKNSDASENRSREKIYYYRINGVPDLWIKAWAKAWHKKGSLVPLEIEIFNDGHYVSPACKLGIYVRKKRIRSIPVPEVAKGKSKKFLSNFFWDDIIADVFLYVDWDKKVPEMNEENNVAYMTMMDSTGMSSNEKNNTQEFITGEAAWKKWTQH